MGFIRAEVFGTMVGFGEDIETGNGSRTGIDKTVVTWVWRNVD